MFKYIEEWRGYLTAQIGRQNAEDILQDAYEKVWTMREYFEAKKPHEQRAIVSRLLKNKVIDKYRRAKSTLRSGDLAGMPKHTNPSVFASLELEDVTREMMEHKMNYLYDYAMGYTAKEVMKRYKLCRNTLGVKIFDARNTLTNNKRMHRPKNKK